MRYSAACWDPLHDLLPPEVFVYGAQAVRRGRTTRTLRVTLPPAGPVDYRTPLLDAIARHDAASVERVLADDPAAVARAGWAGWTPLHHAARAGDAAVLALLVARPEAKAALNARIEDGRCPLMVALHHHHLAAAQVLLDAGAFVREAVLFGCVEDDNEAAVRYLLAHDPAASCLDGESLLAASANGNAALVNLLLDCGLKCSAHSVPSGWAALEHRLTAASSAPHCAGPGGRMHHRTTGARKRGHTSRHSVWSDGCARGSGVWTCIEFASAPGL